MDVKRRKFLKIAGLSAVIGAGLPSALNVLLRENVNASSSPGEEIGVHGGEAQATATHGTTVTSGKRYGLAIDVKKFAEHKGLTQKCIDACISNHNIPEYGNKKDEIKWIWVEPYENAFPEYSQYKRNEELKHLPFLVLCNHCDDPPCVRVCPTKATFKNKDGIVMMDYHRCIGCRFCMAACPYGARSFNWRSPRAKDEHGKFMFIKKLNPEFPTRTRGVVEKCTFCEKRLKKGLQPACVEACAQEKAMYFGDLNDINSEVSKILNERFTIQRNPSLGTLPSVFYIV